MRFEIDHTHEPKIRKSFVFSTVFDHDRNHIVTMQAVKNFWQKAVWQKKVRNQENQLSFSSQAIRNMRKGISIWIVKAKTFKTPGDFLFYRTTV